MSALVRRMQKSKTGAVIVDVFDWYRGSSSFLEYHQLGHRSDKLATASHYPPAERKLLRKFDLSILIFACLSCTSLKILRLDGDSWLFIIDGHAPPP